MATLKNAAKGSKIKDIITAQEVIKKTDYKGVYFDSATDTWGFRLAIKDGMGEKFDTDRKGYKTAYQAKTAREELRCEIKKRTAPVETPKEKNYDKTFEEVYQHYLENRAFEKRPSTLRRQKALWEHHIKSVFGDKKLSEVTKSDMYNYLLKLYKDGDDYTRYEKHFSSGYSYAYVEGFLKFFWLIYGYAYDNDWVDPARYTKDFLNKTTKLRMPQEIQDEEEETNRIEIFNQSEIDQIREIIKNGNLFISFLICYHCGIRISECMGLMWKDFDIEKHQLHIRRQMLYDYDDKVFYLGPLKTKNSKRDIHIPQVLFDYLMKYKEEQDKAKSLKGYRNTEVIYDRNGKDKDDPIKGGDFIQRKENGELITINSVKYWTNKVTKETGINFHFHILRHTNASMLAARNIPLNTLVKHLGHGNANVAQRYYIACTELAEERLAQALEEIC
ncbi:MAG: site-specific integrase [Clostridia bacterium]|nr:site-specific integrase [Clostridia bacterium]